VSELPATGALTSLRVAAAAQPQTLRPLYSNVSTSKKSEQLSNTFGQHQAQFKNRADSILQAPVLVRHVLSLRQCPGAIVNFFAIFLQFFAHMGLKNWNGLKSFCKSFQNTIRGKIAFSNHPIIRCHMTDTGQKLDLDLDL